MINRPIIEKRDPNTPVQPATAAVLNGMSFESLFPIIGQSGSVPVFTQPNFPQIEKQSTNKIDKNIPKSRIVFNKNNFPTIYQAFNLQKTKKIKKKKRNNRLIKRFEIELINIPQKIEEEMQRVLKNPKNKLPIKKTGKLFVRSKSARVTKMRKCVEKIKAITSSALNNDKPVFLPTAEEVETFKRKSTETALVELRKFNNSKSVKLTFDESVDIREYVDNQLNVQVDYQVLKFVNHLNFSQLLKKKKTPMKFRKRLVFGFNEVLKCLQVFERQKLAYKFAKVGHCVCGHAAQSVDRRN